MFDFIVRCIPLGLILALTQDSTINEDFSVAMFFTLIGLVLFSFAVQCAGIWYSIKDEFGSQLKHMVYYYAYPSVFSVSPLLYACFKDSGVPSVLNFFSVLNFEVGVICQSALCVVICVSVSPDLIEVLPATMLVYVVSLCCLAVCVLVIRFCSVGETSEVFSFGV